MENFDFQQTGQELQELINSIPGKASQTDVDELRALYEALTQTGVTPVAAADWPVSDPQENVIYRVAGESSYTDYMWDGTDFIPMATYDNVPTDIPAVGSTDVITAGGVANNGSAFDISEYNKNGATLATYADLSAALVAVPTTVQKGGMSIKFVQSSDNKYVQCRLVKDSWTIDVSYWQGIDEELIAGSKNLVESDGVTNVLVNQLPVNELVKLKSNYWYNSLITTTLQDASSNYVIRTNIIPFNDVHSIELSATNKFRYSLCYCKNGNYVSRTSFSTSAITKEIIKEDFSEYDGIVILLHAQDLTDATIIGRDFANQIGFSIKLTTGTYFDTQNYISDGDYIFDDFRAGIISTNGGINASATDSIYFPDYVPVKPSQKYLIKAPISSNDNTFRFQIAFYNASKTFISRTLNTTVFGDFEFDTLSNAYYIRICIIKGNAQGTSVAWNENEYYSLIPAKLSDFYTDTLGQRINTNKESILDLQKKSNTSLSVDMKNFSQGLISFSTGDVSQNVYHIYYNYGFFVAKGSRVIISIPRPENDCPDLRFAIAAWNINGTYLGRIKNFSNNMYLWSYVADNDIYLKILVTRAQISGADDPRTLSPSDLAGFNTEIIIESSYGSAQVQNALVSYKLQDIFNNGDMVSDNEYLGALVSSMDFDNNGNCYLGMLNNKYYAQEGGEPVLGIFNLNNPNEFENYVIAPRNADLGGFGNVGDSPYDGVAKIQVGTNICKCLWFDTNTVRRIGVRNFDIVNRTFEEGARVIKIKIPAIVGGSWDGTTYEIVDATTEYTEQIRNAFNIAYGMHIYTNTEDALIINSSIVYDGTYYYNSIGFGKGTHPVMRSTDMETWEYVTEIPIDFGQSENPLFYYDGYLYTISRINYYVNRYDIANDTWDASIYLGSMETNTARGAIAVYDNFVYVIQTIGTTSINIDGQNEVLYRGHSRIYKINLNLTEYVSRDWISDVEGNYYVLGVQGTSLYTAVGLDRRAINRGLSYGARGGVVFNRVGYYIKDLV